MARFSLSAVLTVTMAAVATGFAPAISQSRVPTSLGVAIDTSDIKNGMTIELDGEPWKVRRMEENANSCIDWVRSIVIWTERQGVSFNQTIQNSLFINILFSF